MPAPITHELITVQAHATQINLFPVPRCPVVRAVTFSVPAERNQQITIALGKIQQATAEGIGEPFWFRLKFAQGFGVSPPSLAVAFEVVSQTDELTKGVNLA